MKFNRINRGLFFIVSVILVSGTLNSIQASQNEEPKYLFYPEKNDDNIHENSNANNLDNINHNENISAGNIEADNLSFSFSENNTSVHSYQQQQQPAFVVGLPIPMVMQVVPVPMGMPVVPVPVNILLDELQNIKGKIQNIENICKKCREDQKIILNNQNFMLKKISDLEYEQRNAKRKIHNIYSQVNKANYNSIPRQMQRFKTETNKQFNDINQYLQNNISNKEGLKDPQKEYNNIEHKFNRNKYYKNNYNKYFK